MVPAAYAGSTATELAGHLAADDVIIDGGNSYYRDDIQRAEEFAALGIHYLDVGTSGGVFGLDRGFCLMIGGEDEPVRRLDPIFQALAPGAGSAERTLGRTGEPGPAEQGYLHCGPAGAGHFVKMVHNGIEYGVMAAYAEGLAILTEGQRRRRRAGARRRDHAAARPLGLPLRHRHRRGRRGVAARQRDLVVAARPGRDRAARGSGARGLLGPRLRLGRGALDRGGRGRRGRARPRPHRRAVRALQLAAARPTSPTGCCRPCARSSAATRRRPRGRRRGLSAGGGRTPRAVGGPGEPLPGSAIDAADPQRRRRADRALTRTPRQAARSASRPAPLRGPPPGELAPTSRPA